MSTTQKVNLRLTLRQRLTWSHTTRKEHPTTSRTSLPQDPLNTGELSQASGVSTRTLRHYDAIGLLPPSWADSGGLRWYDQEAILRLQRIVILKQLGLRLQDIQSVLQAEQDPLDTLREQRKALADQLTRITEQLTTIDSTITSLQKGIPLMTTELFAGFDPAEHREEVAQRWGTARAAQSDSWRKALGSSGQQDFLGEHLSIVTAFEAAQDAGLDPQSPEAQQAAAQQLRWLRTSAAGTGVPFTADYVRGLAEMYVSDPRFAKNYTKKHPGGAEYVREALLVALLAGGPETPKA